MRVGRIVGVAAAVALGASQVDCRSEPTVKVLMSTDNYGLLSLDDCFDYYAYISMDRRRKRLIEYSPDSPMPAPDQFVKLRAGEVLHLVQAHPGKSWGCYEIRLPSGSTVYLGEGEYRFLPTGAPYP